MDGTSMVRYNNTVAADTDEVLYPRSKVLTALYRVYRIQYDTRLRYRVDMKATARTVALFARRTQNNLLSYTTIM